MNAVVEQVAEPIRLDIGAGMNKKPGFVGVDSIAFDGVDVVHDVRVTPWPWENESVTEVHSAHFLEHLTNFDGKWERVRFFNELYRILIPGGKATIVIPHWCSGRYYGDPTHKEPISEMGFWYLRREWRLVQKNAPHADVIYNPDGYSCDFEATWAPTINAALVSRNAEYQSYAYNFYKEAAQDLIVTLTKR